MINLDIDRIVGTPGGIWFRLINTEDLPIHHNHTGQPTKRAWKKPCLLVLANVITNWSEMEFPAIRLLTFLVIAGIQMVLKVLL